MGDLLPPDEKRWDRAMTAHLSIRNAGPADFDTVVKLELVDVSEEKSVYWRRIFERYVDSGSDRDGGFFLVAESGGEIIGFIIGEVRAWEFGSPPCGWVFALGVAPSARELGVGQLMLKEMGQRLKRAGVTTLRTMVDRENKLTLSFFRSQGLRSGRYIELEKPLDDI